LNQSISASLVDHSSLHSSYKETHPSEQVDLPDDTVPFDGVSLRPVLEAPECVSLPVSLPLPVFLSVCVSLWLCVCLSASHKCWPQNGHCEGCCVVYLPTLRAHRHARVRGTRDTRRRGQHLPRGRADRFHLDGLYNACVLLHSFSPWSLIRFASESSVVCDC
jgi:hypothetical protein